MTTDQVFTAIGIVLGLATLIGSALWLIWVARAESLYNKAKKGKGGRR